MNCCRALFGLLLLCRIALPQTIDDLAARAQAVLDSNPAEAVSLYQQVLAQRPEWPEGWLYMGAGLFSLHRYADASAAFAKGTQLAPQKGDAWGFWGLCEFELHDFTRALEHIAKAEELGLGPNHAFESAVRQSAAFALISESRFDEALAQIAVLSKYNDNSPGVVTAAGLCSLALPRLPSNLTPHEAALVTLAGHAQWASTSRHPDEAQSQFAALLRDYPSERGVHYAYGLFLMESDQQQALSEFQKEIAMHSDFWPALLVSAALETKAGQPESALAQVQRARTLAPPSYNWLCDAEAAKAYLVLRQFDRAVENFEKAIRSRPAYPELHYYLAQAYARVNRKADAQRENREFLRLKGQLDPLASAPSVAP